MLEFVLVWAAVGLIAQFIDGTLGMAYGVSASTALISIGVSSAMASASVHTAEVVTTLASGTSHLKFGNVDRKMALRLLIPGVLGGIVGAIVSTSVSGTPLSVIVGFVLLTMGIIIVIKFLRRNHASVSTSNPSSKTLVPLGLAAGFSDALGGGGWGPIATTTLVANNVKTNCAIGSVNFAEFFVTTAETITFMVLIGPSNFNWLIVLGLMAGGLVCAPLAAWMCRKLPHRILGVFVGATVILLSIRMILEFSGLV